LPDQRARYDRFGFMADGSGPFGTAGADVAGAAVWLASPAAAFITGQALFFYALWATARQPLAATEPAPLAATAS